MPSLNIEQFGDLLKATLPQFETPKYTALVTDLVDHPAAKRLVQKARMGVKSGTKCLFKIKVQTGNSFSHVSPTDNDQVNIVDGIVDAEVNWRKSKVAYAFLEEEVFINKKPSQLLDLIKSREDDAATDWIEGVEQTFWRFPSASDTLTPFGLPYWAPKNATEGFNGGIPSGYSLVANVSPTTYARWNSYTGQYVAVTLDDLILKARTMAEKTNFKPVIPNRPDLGATGNNDRAYFTSLSVRQQFENVADARNDMLGPDVAKMDGNVMFRRAPVEYVPFLDTDTTGPFYQLNFNVFKIMIWEGWWQKRTVISPWPGRRNMTGVFLDTWWQFVCFNRRLLGVLATGTSYPS